jgi:putative N6-adenine-specific DNA methylase
MLTAVALCAVGAEKALANELRRLELAVLESGFGKARFRTDVAGLYRALLELRTADRVLLEADRFPAADFDALFDGVRAIRWEALVPRGRTVAIAKVRTNRSALSAVTSVQAVAHKAVAERLCAAWGLRRLDDDAAAAEIRVYLERDEASILLDLSGEPLFRRGYRTEGGAAPLRETTAAAIILLSGWKRKFPLYDPFCGSGTFAVEAALYAWDAAPGLGRSFAIDGTLLADPDLAAGLRAAAAARVDFTRTIRIAGSDLDGRAVSIARANAERARELASGRTADAVRAAGPGLRLGGPAAAGMPEFRQAEFSTARADYPEGFLLTNPPYGERLGDPAEAEEIYRRMDRFNETFPGWSAGVITNHPGFESHFGRAADSVRELTNGALRSYLYLFQKLGRLDHVDHR